MKSKISIWILSIGLLTLSAKNTYATANTSSNYTVLNDIKAINKIEVRGNVQLFISDNAPDQVTVYNKYYAETALVQSRNGVLRISSYSNDKLVVWIKSESLQSISAFDNAEIRSFGPLSKIEFYVELHNKATANLDLDAFSVNVTLRDESAISLSGRVEEFGMNRNLNTLVVNNGFSVGRNTENKIVNQAGKEITAGIE